MCNYLFLVIGGILLFCGCQKNDGNSAAKIYCFTYSPYFHIKGYSVGSMETKNYYFASDNFSYSIEQIAEDPDYTLMADTGIQIEGKPTQFNQCGTYHIVVNHYGEVTDIPNFQYRGETQVQVAQGPGWSLVISREDWGDAK